MFTLEIRLYCGFIFMGIVFQSIAWVFEAVPFELSLRGTAIMLYFSAISLVGVVHTYLRYRN